MSLRTDTSEINDIALQQAAIQQRPKDRREETDPNTDKTKPDFTKLADSLERLPNFGPNQAAWAALKDSELADASGVIKSEKDVRGLIAGHFVGTTAITAITTIFSPPTTTPKTNEQKATDLLTEIKDSIKYKSPAEQAKYFHEALGTLKAIKEDPKLVITPKNLTINPNDPKLQLGSAILANADPKNFQELSKALIELKDNDKESTQKLLSLTLKEFHDKPEVLQKLTEKGAAMLAPSHPELSKMLKAFGPDFIQGIPKDKIDEVVKFGAIASEKNIQIKDIFGDPQALANKMGLDKEQVKNTQKLIADSGLGVFEKFVKAQGFNLDRNHLAALLDPKHPDSIIDANGNISTAKLSQNLTQKAMNNPQTPKEMQIYQEANNKMYAAMRQPIVNGAHQKIEQRRQEALNGPFGWLFSGIINRKAQKAHQQADQWYAGITDRKNGKPPKSEVWKGMNEAYGQHYWTAAAQRDAAVQSKIGAELNSKLGSIDKSNIQLLQNILNRSSMGGLAANPNTRIGISDLENLGSIASNLNPKQGEQLTEHRAFNGKITYANQQGKESYYQITNVDEFKKAHPNYRGTIELGQIAMRNTDNTWSFVNKGSSGFSKIYIAMRYSDRNAPTANTSNV